MPKRQPTDKLTRFQCSMSSITHWQEITRFHCKHCPWTSSRIVRRDFVVLRVDCQQGCWQYRIHGLESLGVEMRITKAILLAALLFLTVGTAGCTTGKPFCACSSQAPELPFTASQQTVQTAVHETAVHQTSHEVSYSPSATPLSTLGPNDNFRELVGNASGTVLVDFYADWCGPCRKQGGILEDMESSSSQKRASIIKVNVDQHQQLAREFDVSSLPTLLVIKNGMVIERQNRIG